MIIHPAGRPVAISPRLREPRFAFEETSPMITRPPAEIGMTLDEVDTPALIVELDAFERNLRRLPERIAGTGVRARPHAKTHKCPVIALKQVALGAVGVCVQEVSEAEAMG